MAVLRLHHRMLAPDVTTMIDLDALPLAMICLDHDLKITRINTLGEVLLGVSRTSASGRTLSSLLTQDEGVLTLLKHARDTQGRVSGIVHLEGPTLVSHGQLHGTVSFSQTSGYTLALLESARPETSETDQAGLAAFGRILGHEVKNPLAGLSGAAQLLLRKARTDQSELLNLILDEAARITRLIDKLSAFELFSTPKCSPHNIHEILEQVLKSENIIFHDQVVLERNFDPSLPAIFGDADHLHEAFQNIIRNGCEAVAQSGTGDCVTITTRFGLGHQAFGGGTETSTRFVIITISDNGPGISAEDQVRIFEMFQTTKSNGSGLGLTIASQIIAAHNGHIALESDNGMTRFKIYLPIASTSP